ncbi:MAG: acylase [Bacteroidota bacterium]
MKVASLFTILFSISIACTTAEPPPSTKIHWDKWGVPHIYAQNDDELYFAAGYAQMHLRGNLILELYGRARGNAASIWGEDYVSTDVLIQTMGFPELAKEWTAKQDPELQKIVQSFVSGMNNYAETHPEAFDDDKKLVLPLKAEDVNAHALYVVYTIFVGGEDLGRVQNWSEAGSNAFAVAGKRAANGNAMLVQNPHLPWFGEFLFTEMHFNTPDNNLYGATLVGFPTIAIGFNDYLGWTHTNNTIDNADTYELQLSGDGYLLDGKVKAFEKSTKTLKIKAVDGSIAEKEIEIWHSEHGPVVKKGNQKALAVRMVGYDRPDSFLQWVRMGKAKNFEAFEEALQMSQIPFWNVMYADKQDNIFYLFNGLVPKRSNGGWSYWNRIIPGGKSEDIWQDVHPYSDLPRVKNPAQGWLQNSNDPPWTCTYPVALDADDFPPYMAPRFMSFRPQKAVEMLNGDQSITFDELVEYKLSTRMGMADRILDDLFQAVDQYGGETAKEAKSVLSAWDRQADPQSKGTLLFTQWARRARLGSQSTFAKPWSEDDVINTPDGLADPPRAVKVLEEVATAIKEDHGRLDIPWGDVYRIKYNGIDLPGNGASGLYGVVRVAWEGGRNRIGGGDSWVGVIEFDEKIKAKVLLSYGNSSMAGSQNNGDQLQLFSDKEMRDAHFYQQDVETHTVMTEILKNGKFEKTDSK